MIVKLTSKTKAIETNGWENHSDYCCRSSLMEQEIIVVAECVCCSLHHQLWKNKLGGQEERTVEFVVVVAHKGGKNCCGHWPPSSLAEEETRLGATKEWMHWIGIVSVFHGISVVSLFNGFSLVGHPTDWLVLPCRRAQNEFVKLWFRCLWCALNY